MSAKLSNQKAENESLKQEIIELNGLIDEGSKKEKELSEKLALLTESEEKKSTLIDQKQLEIEKLSATVSELTSANQSSSSCSEDNKNGQVSLNARDAFGSNHSVSSQRPKTQRSKICILI